MFAGVVALLIVASLVGALLAQRAASAKSREVIANLNARTKAWWVMVAVLGCAFAAGQGATLVLFAFASFFALREFISLTPTSSGDSSALRVGVLRAAAGAVRADLDTPVRHVLDLPTGLRVPVPARGLGVGLGRTQLLARSAKIQWAVMVCVYCVSHAPALLLLELPGFDGPNALLVMYLLLVVQLSDVLQYVFGKIFSQTPLAPQVSPSKTVEGLVGGGLTAVAVGGSLWWLTPFALGRNPWRCRPRSSRWVSSVACASRPSSAAWARRTGA